MQEADVMAQPGELSVVEEDRPSHETTEIAGRGNVERAFGCVQQFVGAHALSADFREICGGDCVCSHLIGTSVLAGRPMAKPGSASLRAAANIAETQRCASKIGREYVLGDGTRLL